MSDTWQQDGLDAWHSFQVSQDDAEPTYEAADETTHADDHDDLLMSMFLSAEGLDMTTADPNQILDAAEKADAWHARAEQVFEGQLDRDISRASLADEKSLSNTLDQFVADHAGGDAEAATPYIELAFQAMEDGAGFDEAMAQAAAAIRKWNGEINAAARTEHYGSMGYREGMSAALSNFMQSRNGPAHRSATPLKPGPAGRNSVQGLGSSEASKDAISNAVGAFAARQREKAALKGLAKDRARGR